MIEVELRGLLTQDQNHKLLSYLQNNGTGFEQDNKHTTFFHYPDGILKLVENTSKKQFKLSLKTGNEYNNLGMDETEIYIPSIGDYRTASSLLKSLGFTIKGTVVQQRINVTYKDVQFSLKFTESWGYHFEAEMLVQKRSSAIGARQHIINVCNELNIKYMEEEELQAFIETL